MNLLITGATGFIGTNLVEHLVKKHDIIGVDIATPRETFHPITYVLGNLLDRNFIEKLFKTYNIQQILHFAAQARVEPSYDDPLATYRINVEATLNLLEQAITHNVRMVYASSEIIYGQSDTYPTKEHYTLRPDSPYAASKAAADLLVQQCTKARTVVIRSGMGYGERSPPSQVITKMMLRCIDDKPLLFPKDAVKHPTRDVNYVKNFVEGIEKVVEHPDVEGVFNMGSGREIDIHSLAELIIRTVGKGSIEYSSDFKYRPGEEGKRTWMDNSKARDTFGYEPRYTLHDGLKRSYEWLRDGGAEFYGW